MDLWGRLTHQFKLCVPSFVDHEGMHFRIRLGKETWQNDAQEATRHCKKAGSHAMTDFHLDAVDTKEVFEESSGQTMGPEGSTENGTEEGASVAAVSSEVGIDDHCLERIVKVLVSEQNHARDGAVSSETKEGASRLPPLCIRV